MDYSIEIDGKQFTVEEFNLDLFPEWMTDWKTGGITDPLGQLVSWLWDQISGAFDYISSKIWDWLVDTARTITNALSPVIEAVSDFVGGLVRGVGDALSSFSGWVQTAIGVVSSTLGRVATSLAAGFSQVLSSVSSALSSLWGQINSAIGSVVSTLGSWAGKIYSWIQGIPGAISGFIDTARTWIANAVKGFIDFWGGVWNAIQGGVNWLVSGLSSIGATLGNALSGLGSQIMGWINGAIQSLGAGINTIGTALAGIPAAVSSVFNSIAKTLTGAWETFTKAVGNTVSGISTFVGGAVNGAVSAITGVVDGIKKGVGDVQIALQGFVNPMAQLATGFMDFPAKVVKFITEDIPKFFTKDIPEFFTKLPERLLEGLKTMGKGIVDFFGAIGTSIVQGAKGLADALTGAFKGIVQPIIDGLTKAIRPGSPSKELEVIGKKVYKAYSEYYLKTLKGLSKHSQVPMQFVTSFIIENWQPFAAAYTAEISGIAADAAHPVKNLQILEFVKGLLHKLGIPRILTAASAGLAAYAVSPIIRRGIYGLVRPLIPPPDVLVKGVWRGKLDPNETAQWLSESGFAPEFHDAIYASLRQYPKLLYPGDPAFRLVQRGMVNKDKFLQYSMFDGFSKEDAELVWTVIYEIPQIGDIFRLYWRGELPEAEAKKYVQWLGYSPELAAKVFTLSKVIPGISDLIRYAVREGYPVSEDKPTARLMETSQHFDKMIEWAAKQGLSRYFAQAEWWSHWILPPLDRVFQAYFMGRLTEEEMRRLVVYHDFNPDIRPGFKVSEQDVIFKTQFLLPTRIQARWLLRWKVMSKAQYENLYKVMGYGNFVGTDALTTYDGKKLEVSTKDLVEAEYRNALLEERTLVRTSYLTMYKEGMTLTADLIKGLESLFFLDDEIKMLAEKADLDRQIDIYKDYSREIIGAYSEGAITLEDLTTELGKYVKDPAVVKQITGTLAVRKLKDSVSRIRKEASTTIDRVLDLFEDGLMPEEVAKVELGKYVGAAKMLPEELSLILAQSKLRRDRTFLKWSLSALTKMLRRGQIDQGKFSGEVQKLGIPKEMVGTIVESEGKYYELSPTNILYYGTYIPIPEDWLKKELDRIGVPKDHQEIMLQYNRLAPTSDERAKVVTDVIDAYATGYMDLKQLTSWLVKLGKREDEVEVLLTHAEADRWQNVNKLRVKALTEIFGTKKLDVKDFISGLMAVGMSKDMAVETAAAEYAKVYDDFIPKDVFNYEATLE